MSFDLSYRGVPFQHLAASVSGPVKQALKDIPVTSTNFTVPWNKWKHRYDSNKRRIYVHLESLINLPQVSSESSEQIGRLVDKADGAVQGLTDLGCPVTEYDNWFVHLLFKKLDSSTNRDRAIHEEGVKDFSAYDNLFKFLENMINSLSDPFEIQHYEKVFPLPSSKNV